MRRQCFTFTELIVLLVVIVLLFLLAGIFLPSRGGSRKKARRISCIGNLKQIDITLFMYAGDYNYTFPDECTSNTVTTILDSTAKGLNLLIEYNYLSEPAIYNCPATTDTAAKHGNTITTLATERTCSYVYAPGLMTGTSNIYGNPDSAIVADMTSVASKRPIGNHDRYGNILFQRMHGNGFSARNHLDWFLLNYGSSYDPSTQKGSKDSSWALTEQYFY